MRLILTFLLLISLQSYAQIHPALIEQFETAFQEYSDATQVRGMSIAIRTADEVWTDQYGISGESEPLTENHLFAMGSVSKTITSATILQMYEEGLLSLEDPLSEHLDPYANVDPTVTIRELLNHTSGIYGYTNHPDFLDDVFSNPEQIFLLEDIVANYVLAPDFVAGTDFNYSNTNYALLGLIINDITGQTYYEEARERFDFDTNYPSLAIPPFEISPEDLAHLWMDLDSSGVVDVQATGFSLNSLFSGLGPAGAYAATSKDLSQWLRDLFTGEILQPATMDELLTPSAFTDNYGLGVIMISDACSAGLVGHNGNIFYTTATYYDEEKDIVVTVQSNDGETNVDTYDLTIDLFCIINDFNMSIDDKISRESFAVYPNPFTDQIAISYELSVSRKVSLSLLDLTGRQVINMDGSNKSPGVHQEILHTNLPSGMYFLKLMLGDQTIHKKIIKN